jgi:hypothetical protein
MAGGGWRSVANRDQVLRFAVGTAMGPRSRTWRLWVPKGKGDVYVSSRRIGNSVKVSLHEPGPGRFALTQEFVDRGTFQPPEGKDPRLAIEWERPRPRPPNGAVRPLALIVPWDEVIPRDEGETGEVVWVPPPPKGSAVHFDVVYVPNEMRVSGHPGARSMGTLLVGQVELANGERVYVTWLLREIDDPLQEGIDRLRSVRALDADGKPIEETGMLGFGTEPNPDAADGTEVATLLDVTPPDG